MKTSEALFSMEPFSYIVGKFNVMSVRENLDKMLKWIYESKTLERHQVLTSKDFDDPMKYMDILNKDQYVIRTWMPREYDRYRITGLGEKFFEEGGYSAETIYNRKILKIAEDSKNYSLWAIGLA